MKHRAAAALIRRSDETPLNILLDILDNLYNKGFGGLVERSLQNRSDPELAQEMIARLSSPDDYIREVACTVLGHSGNLAATGHLLRMIDDPHPRVRRAAVFAVGTLKDYDAIPALERQLSKRENDAINVVIALEWTLRDLRLLEETETDSTDAFAGKN